MSKTQTLSIPVNRVEGDLKLSAEMADHRVVDAFCSGTMYRGFENLLIGRGALDGLAITPRICGICGLSHLTAAARALDMAAGVDIPANATRIRNLALMVEMLQNDMRQSFLMFTPDLANPVYRDIPLFDEATRRYTPFKGDTVVDVIRTTKKLLEVIAILGGQWPHTSFIVPGGISSAPSQTDLVQCRLLLQDYRKWYETRILGCDIERFLDVRKISHLEAWLEEDPAHQNSELGFFIRYAREIGLDRIGQADDQFISFGYLDLPDDTRVSGTSRERTLVPSGFATGTRAYPFDQAKISEHVKYSWFKDYPGGKHPLQGVTDPYASGTGGDKYSWAKAPRYTDMPAETGALAEMVVGKNPLFIDLVNTYGGNCFTRQLARIVRTAEMIPAMHTWLSEIKDEESYYVPPGKIPDTEAYGLTHAARGVLGHWIRIEAGKIQKYQIITPTAWNASPRDTAGRCGPIEKALEGTPVKDMDNPVELGHVVRSFDPCLVCTVHAIDLRSDKRSSIALGI